MKSTSILRLLGASLVLALAAGCTQIDTGNVGVESTMGQVKPDIMQPGVHFTLFKTVTEVCAKELPLSINDLKPQTSDKINMADMDVDIYVVPNPAKAAVLKTKWPADLTEFKGDGACTAIGMNFVTRQAREVLYDVTSRFGSATIHTERTKIAAETQKQLQASLNAEAGKDLFVVSNVNVRNLVTDPALEANIKAAAQAQFKNQEEKNKLENSRITAERQRVEAQGEADAIRIKAEAVSKNGGAEYVQLQAIAKWNGVLPATNAGGAVPFINVKP